jgi:hypothetical protein
LRASCRRVAQSASQEVASNIANTDCGSAGTDSGQTSADEFAECGCGCEIHDILLTME